MKTAERVALLYAVSVVGAGAIAYYRGKRDAELMQDVLVHSLIAGTALNVVGWLLLESSEPIPIVAQLNSASLVDLGKLTLEGKKLLERLDTDTVFADLRKNGVKVGPVPDNPSVVQQDAE